MPWTLQDIENLKKGKRIANDANDLNRAICDHANLSGSWFVWRQNNMGVYDKSKGVYRKSPGSIKGVSDVIGIHKKIGIWFAVEGKAGNDRASKDQLIFIDRVVKTGGFGCIVRSFDEYLERYNQFMESLRR